VIWFFEEVPCWQFELAASMGKQSKRPVVMRNRVEVKKTAPSTLQFKYDNTLQLISKRLAPHCPAIIIESKQSSNQH
jgi:hypothetical protein